ncbi:hypothetical protein C8Q75DRAFT_460256 [Abortiporus biennis]|nr:hypothetical protein C8Q75DRAFT_460256 [Abortiporus biennis]
MDVLKTVYEQPQVKLDNSRFSDVVGFLTMIDSYGDVPVESAELAVNALIEDAIYRFGYIARDVFKAIFNRYITFEEHSKTIDNLDWLKLQQIVKSLVGYVDYPEVSHQVIVQEPHLEPESTPRFKYILPVTWTLHFKSEWVAQQFLHRLILVENSIIREQYSVFSGIPGAQPIAERLLEPLSHNTLIAGITNPWTLFSMTSNQLDPPIFTIDRSAPQAPGSEVQFDGVKRTLYKYQCQDLPKISFENNGYYLPLSPIFPLIDAFIVNIDQDQRSAILWAIQITGSSSPSEGEHHHNHHHGSSELGYIEICKVVTALQSQLRDYPPPIKAKKFQPGERDYNPCVVVKYLYVVPQSPSTQWAWRFPKGWNQNYERNDHRGACYCLELPIGEMPKINDI